MEDKDMNAFSWTALFFVTSFCFFAFSGLMNLLDGNGPGLFIWIGFIALFLGLLSGAAGWMTRPVSKDKHEVAG